LSRVYEILAGKQIAFNKPFAESYVSFEDEAISAQTLKQKIVHPIV